LLHRTHVAGGGGRRSTGCHPRILKTESCRNAYVVSPPQQD